MTPPRKPEARIEKVEDLVAQVRNGLVRLPQLPRRLRWTSSNVAELFDSIYRGYPIGALVFHKRPAVARRLEVGPLVVDAPETNEAWWVVDGQQRVAALAACLDHPMPIPARPSWKDPFVLYFDAVDQNFEPPPATGRIPTSWVPLPCFLDATVLSDWIRRWQHRDDEDLRLVVHEAGIRIREYPVPLYLIETEDSAVAKQIFYRVNTTGKRPEWTEVHDVLFGDSATSPSTLAELSEDLAEIGMGRLDERRLLSCLVALHGKDPTRTLGENIHRDPEVLRNAVEEALPVIRRVLSFLRRDAGIPHLRLLPKSILLDVLSRFFAWHEDPRPRTRILLARWFWRAVLGAGHFDDRNLLLRGIAAVGEDEEASVQELLGLVQTDLPRALELPPKFDSRAGSSRIVLLALVHLGPRQLADGNRIDIAGSLEKEDKDVFVKILKQPGLERSRSPANRLVQAPGTSIRPLLLDRISRHGAEDPILTGHAISSQAALRLEAGDLEGFLIRRAETLSEEVQRFGERMAAWKHNDRPSVAYILEEAGVEL